MTRWKMVPVELTPEMHDAAIDAEREAFANLVSAGVLMAEGHVSARRSSIRAGVEAAIAAAPAWEPSDEQCDRMFKALGTPWNGGRRQMRETMRAALKAALGGKENDNAS